jgi:hypothetical protein
MQPNIISPFFRQLYNILVEDIENRSQALIDGGCINIGDGLDITGIKYRESIAYIQALKQVIQLGLQLDHDQYGIRNKNDGEDF